MVTTKIITAHADIPNYHQLPVYKENGGYSSLEKAFKMGADDIIKEVKASNLRGRGGAGFPTGLKWSFLLKSSPKPKYLLCNADESEPGTFKDRWIIEKNPHAMIEGIIVSAFALDAHKAYIYVRGELPHEAVILERAVAEAYDYHYLGKNILGSGFNLDVVVFRGAGAYICGEETGLISSLEGNKGQPKVKPPFPAVSGFLGCPTIVNNVETLATVPWILMNGAEAFTRIGTAKSAGTRLFSISGLLKNPGVFEKPLGYPIMKLINEDAGGLLNGKKLKAVIPGGSSCPILTATECETANLDFESIAEKGSMLGSGGVVVINEDQCMVDLLSTVGHFYHHESCGQCTPCREGTGWASKIVDKILASNGTGTDLQLILDIADNMAGRTICALADAMAMPLKSYITKFKDEFVYHIEHKKCNLVG